MSRCIFAFLHINNNCGRIATGTATVYDASGNLIATSESWTAGEDGIARLVTINLDIAESTEITIKLTQSNVGVSGNVSLVGMSVLGYRK